MVIKKINLGGKAVILALFSVCTINLLRRRL